MNTTTETNSLNRYRIFATGYGSQRYGPCEVCNKHGAEIFLQSKEERYKHSDGSEGWAHQGSIFGHKDCLEQQQVNK